MTLRRRPGDLLRDQRGDVYKIIEILVEGPMTYLLRVNHPRSDRLERALKLLRCPPELSAQARATRVSSFGREIRFLEEIGQLHHPCLLGMLDHGVTIEGEPFILLEPLQGESLRSYLLKRGELSFKDVITIGRPIALALSALHDQQIVHRDLSTDNLFVRNLDSRIPGEPQVKIIDFGLSKFSGHVLHTGLHSASIAHAAPEQAAGKDVIDARADQYSFASILTEMLTGQPANVNNNPLDMLAPATLPPSALRALSRALSRNPRDRFANIPDFWHELCSTKDPRETTMLLGQAGASATTTMLRRASAAPRSWARRLWPF